ncbi:hypothetical protein AGABI2DRAFT_202473 [Agaricus bisporus var. bisporus H97]|uniref:hypothetical protein n=1 Tax=Agaricus bisporus var. bisporus (strain H97 / ATCC MYA-4626 / FGSC 10389) TaxID=936046 RepID=UPI00029F5B5D|nr:hypothetical protein AGABI2DRAFT_202473 [Agaricus bisporus var. bisporus H97]EKV48092.1 hypothetical protein AGABI2DRAFT_202473 [Agaricus bisporus var. bisporus H97]
MASTRQKLVQATQRFCDAFADKADISAILSHFSKKENINAYEHGNQALAPFLGRFFEGMEGVRTYFEIIGSLLAYEDIRFGVFIVDAEERKVAVRGWGEFTWLETGESWHEVFAYMLDFDEEEKIKRYQVWADSGAAYLARIGKLKEIEEGDHGRVRSRENASD